MASGPFDHVKRNMVSNLILMYFFAYLFIARQAAGTAIPSMTSIELERIAGDPEQEHVLKWAAATMYIGKYTYGSHSTRCALTWFLSSRSRL
jgi:hypothetical protein